MNSEKYIEFGNSAGIYKCWESLLSGTSHPFSYLDNTIAYNLCMAINCWSQFKVTQPGLNKIHFPDDIIMLRFLNLFNEAA